MVFDLVDHHQFKRLLPPLAHLLRKAADQIRSGDTAEQVLWTVWDGTGWPRRLANRGRG